MELNTRDRWDSRGVTGLTLAPMLDAFTGARLCFFFLSLSLSFDSHRVSAGVALLIPNKTRQDQAHVS